jgi:hypothetical protein
MAPEDYILRGEIYVTDGKKTWRHQQITSYAIEVILQMVKEANRPNKITVYAEK